MIADSYIVPQCEARPGSLGGLMTLYEGNFIKLLALMPWLAGLRGRVEIEALVSASAGSVSCVPDDLDLHLAVEGATRHTLDLRLTYLFAEGDECRREPDLELRVYLDARMVEAVAWSDAPRHHRLRALSGGSPRELDRRWARNIMLGKWLEYLIERGHRYARPGD